MNKTGTLIIMLMLQTGLMLGQVEKPAQISFLPVFGKIPVSAGEIFYRLENGDSIQFETIKFYVSDIQLLNNENVVWKESGSFHLIDFSVPNSLNLSLDIPENLLCNRLRFRLGIDSTTNCSGALGGDLDPTKGMYWTWDNGYINAKIEGKSNRCLSRNHEFQIHLGGYRQEVKTNHLVSFDLKSHKNMLVLVNLKPVFDSLDLSNTHHIMSAGKSAVLLSEILAQNLKTE